MGLPLLFPLTQLPAPSSPTLLPRGEKGANHIAPHRHPTVGCNKRSAVHREHMADLPPHPQPFSREGRREQNHGDPHRHPTVGCNKRSAVHHEHILIAVQFTSFFAPYSCCVFQGDEPSWGLRHK